MYVARYSTQPFDFTWLRNSFMNIYIPINYSMVGLYIEFQKYNTDSPLILVQNIQMDCKNRTPQAVAIQSKKREIIGLWLRGIPEMR